MTALVRPSGRGLSENVFFGALKERKLRIIKNSFACQAEDAQTETDKGARRSYVLSCNQLMTHSAGHPYLLIRSVYIRCSLKIWARGLLHKPNVQHTLRVYEQAHQRLRADAGSGCNVRHSGWRGSAEKREPGAGMGPELGQISEALLQQSGYSLGHITGLVILEYIAVQAAIITKR